jgi:hypothetical protein
MAVIFKITPALRADIAKHYGIAAGVCNADVMAEYRNLARKGYAGICGDARREALRAIFARHGLDPVHGQTPNGGN